jgi:hypothetical protein
VLDEIAFGETEMASRRLELVADFALLQSTEEARQLTKTSWIRGCCRLKPEATLRTLRWRPFIRWIFY